MTALWALTVANIKSYTRDRAALFWTLAFPLIFIFMFGFIFQGGGGGGGLQIGWVDEDGSPASAALRAAFVAQEGNELTDLGRDPAVDQMREGELDTVIVDPGRLRSRAGGRIGRGRATGRADERGRLHRPVAPEPDRRRVPVGRSRARGRQPRWSTAASSCPRRRRSRPRT